MVQISALTSSATWQQRHVAALFFTPGIRLVVWIAALPPLVATASQLTLMDAHFERLGSQDHGLLSAIG